MKNVNRRVTDPLGYKRTRRNHPVMHLSSTMPGVCHPVATIPLFREDGARVSLDAVVEMLETKELLMNQVTARFTAWLVPFLALDRFQGSRDEFDRSYMGEASLNGEGVIDFMEEAALPVGGAAAVPLYLAAGLHGQAADQINTAFREGYNQVWNFRARQRSKELTARLLTDTSLAPAFWQHVQFPHIVADFDQAYIEGKVRLDIEAAKLPVSGIGVVAAGSYAAGPVTVRETATGTVGQVYGNAQGSTSTSVYIERSPGGDYPNIYADLGAGVANISLAAWEEAKKTAWFAQQRVKFEGHDDDYIIDMLMQGLTIPDQHLKQPIQVFDKTVGFRAAKRYATDSGNLDDSAVSGVAECPIDFYVPRVNTGGVVIVLMEILPQQLWERQKDWFFHTRADGDLAAHERWPDAERDTLDREKVDVVYNEDIDVTHSDPTGYFGFEPMNAKYNRAPPTIGGKFHRPSADTLTDDARQRLWAVEGSNPTLTDSFFIVDLPMHIKPFLDQVNDPFEITASGNAVINGLTQFGGLLIESTGNYEAVQAHAPTEQIDKDAG